MVTSFTCPAARCSASRAASSRTRAASRDCPFPMPSFCPRSRRTRRCPRPRSPPARSLTARSSASYRRLACSRIATSSTRAARAEPSARCFSTLMLELAERQAIAFDMLSQVLQRREVVLIEKHLLENPVVGEQKPLGDLCGVRHLLRHHHHRSDRRVQLFGHPVPPLQLVEQVRAGQLLVLVGDSSADSTRSTSSVHFSVVNLEQRSCLYSCAALLTASGRPLGVLNFL